MELLNTIGPWQLFILLIVLLPFVLLPIIALVDVLKNEFTGNNKIIWVLVILFFPLLGSILYFMIAKKHPMQPLEEEKQ